MGSVERPPTAGEKRKKFLQIEKYFAAVKRKKFCGPSKKVGGGFHGCRCQAQ
jgi:hypothetical protein